MAAIEVESLPNSGPVSAGRPRAPSLDTTASRGWTATASALLAVRHNKGSTGISLLLVIAGAIVCISWTKVDRVPLLSEPDQHSQPPALLR